jgi:hypothetical protein
MSVSVVSGAAGFPVHPFVDPRALDAPKPALGANAGTAFTPPSASTGEAGAAAARPPRDHGRHVDTMI